MYQRRSLTRAGCNSMLTAPVGKEPTMSDDDKNSPPEFQKEVDAFVEGAAGLLGGLRDIFLKSKDEVVKGASLGKTRIELFQLRKDREALMQRLGEQAHALMVDGGLKHPDLSNAFGKIRDVDQRIEDFEAEAAEIERTAGEGLTRAAREATEVINRVGGLAAGDEAPNADAEPAPVPKTAAKAESAPKKKSAPKKRSAPKKKPDSKKGGSKKHL